jgi:glutathione S-transferase
MLTLYSMPSSGNAYKVRLLAAHLGLALHLVDIDIFKGENRTPDFLMKNPQGQIPVLELPGGRILTESNAILVHLSEGTRLLPEDAFERAQALQWMFFEQHSHEPAIAAARFWLALVKGGRELKRDQIDDWMERGYAALAAMERHLGRETYFAGGRFTVADIALYAHTHVAQEGDFDLATFPAVRDWLKRISTEPRHIAMM